MKVFISIVFLVFLWACVAENGQPKEITAQERKDLKEWAELSKKECESYYENLPPKRLIVYAEMYGKAYARQGLSLWEKMIYRCIEFGGAAKAFSRMDKLMEEAGFGSVQNR